MSGTIDFQHDRAHDIVIATPHWKIATEADVTAWWGQWVAHMKTYGRKMDIIVVLDDFHVTPAIGPKWGEHRAKLHKEYFRHSIRVHANRDVKLFVNTSGARFNIATEEAATVVDAIAAIQEIRRRWNAA
jgi:hypothetical protein